MRKPTINKTSSYRNRIVAAAAMAMSAASGLAQASIVLTNYTEDAASFTATYAFTPDLAPTILPPSGTSWLASLTQTFIPTGLGAGIFQFDWSGQHPLTGVIAADNCQFQNSVLTGMACNQTLTVPDGANSDTYNFTVNLVSGGGTATFTGMHNVATVPIPGAAWLFASGILGLAGAAHRHARKQEQT